VDRTSFLEGRGLSEGEPVVVTSTHPHESGEPLWYFPPVETHLIRSEYVAQTFKVEVMQPARRRGESTRFPVVYATDGNWSFDMLKGISHILQTHERDGPRFILVAIGYPSDSPRGGAVLRARDLTFRGYPEFRVRHPGFEDVPVAEPGTPQTHGGEAFLQFIARELIPFIDKEYETLPGQRTYFGHSGGGGLGLFALFTRPELFNRYVISSANMIFHGESSAGVPYDNHDFLLQEARAFIASGRALHGVSLFLSVGTEEEFEEGLGRSQLTSSFYRMAALLKAAAIPGLTLMVEALQGETHMTAWPIAFIRGVPAVFRVRE
jgi:predicted alpha/beta superfamily hydrolase